MYLQISFLHTLILQPQNLRAATSVLISNQETIALSYKIDTSTQQNKKQYNERENNKKFSSQFGMELNLC